MCKKSFLLLVFFVLQCNMRILIGGKSGKLGGVACGNMFPQSQFMDETLAGLQLSCALILRDAIITNNILAADCLFAAPIDVHIRVPYCSRYLNYDQNVSLLFVAIDSNRAHMVRGLLAAGVDPHAYAYMCPHVGLEFFPMRHAMLTAGADVVQALWDAGARKHAKILIDEGASFANLAALRALYRLSGIPINIKELLIQAFICRYFPFDISRNEGEYMGRKRRFIEYLLQQFQTPVQRSAAAQEALYSAVGSESFWAIPMLVNAGADVAKENDRGWAALDMFMPYSFYERESGAKTLQALLEHGADIERQLRRPGTKKGDPGHEGQRLFVRLLRQRKRKPGLKFLFNRGANFPTQEELDSKCAQTIAMIRGCAEASFIPRVAVVGKSLAQDCGLPGDLVREVLMFSGIPAEYIAYGAGQNKSIASKKRKASTKRRSAASKHKKP